MRRFLALIWSTESDAPPLTPLQREALNVLTAQWHCAVHCDGFIVWCKGLLISQQCCILPHEHGAILGDVFLRHGSATDDSACPRVSWSQEHLERVVCGRAEALLHECWGDYVALLRDNAGHISILKDPTGSWPCYVVAPSTRMTACFSDIADAADAMLIRPRVEPAYVRQRLTMPEQYTEGSGLRGVRRVFGGQRLDLAPARHTQQVRQIWNASSFASVAGAHTTTEVYASELRASILSTTRTWACNRNRILLRCSGGLDSAIVAACLARSAADRVVAYTYNNVSSPADPWPWASRAVVDLHAPHLRVTLDPATMDLSVVAAVPRAVEPMPVIGFYQRAVIEAPLACNSRITCVMSGDGGDSGFGRDAIRDVVLETLLRRGPRFALLRLAAQVGLHTEESVSGVLARSVREWLRLPRTHSHCNDVRRLVHPELLHEPRSSAPVHPWLHSLPYPQLLSRRLGTLLLANDYYNTSTGAEGPPVIAPLCSQPVIEQLLRTPLESLFLDGRERGLARHAFRDLVPAEILERTWKDRAPGFFETLILSQHRFLREMLLDGWLVRERYLDRRAVERALSPARIKSHVYPAEIFQHLGTELWGRHWR